MLELKQVDHLRLATDVPEALAGQLKTGDSVFFYTSAFPGKKMTGFLSRKSDNVNLQFRSERIEADINNNEGILSPGMYADVVLKSKGNMKAFAVEKSAVVTSTERKYVLIVRNNKIQKEDVMTGNETKDKIEISGNFKEGERIIINANDEIKEGIEVK